MRVRKISLPAPQRSRGHSSECMHILRRHVLQLSGTSGPQHAATCHDEATGAQLSRESPTLSPREDRRRHCCTQVCLQMPSSQRPPLLPSTSSSLRRAAQHFACGFLLGGSQNGTPMIAAHAPVTTVAHGCSLIDGAWQRQQLHLVLPADKNRLLADGARVVPGCTPNVTGLGSCMRKQV